MASFALYATTCGARKHAWTNVKCSKIRKLLAGHVFVNKTDLDWISSAKIISVSRKCPDDIIIYIPTQYMPISVITVTMEYLEYLPILSFIFS